MMQMSLLGHFLVYRRLFSFNNFKNNWNLKKLDNSSEFFEVKTLQKINYEINRPPCIYFIQNIFRFFFNRLVWSTQQVSQLKHLIRYIPRLLRCFSIFGFKEGRIVFSFLKVKTTLLGALTLLNEFINLSESFPRYCMKTNFSFPGSSSSSSSFSDKLISGLINFSMVDLIIGS